MGPSWPLQKLPLFISVPLKLMFFRTCKPPLMALKRLLVACCVTSKSPLDKFVHTSMFPKNRVPPQMMGFPTIIFRREPDHLGSQSFGAWYLDPTPGHGQEPWAAQMLPSCGNGLVCKWTMRSAKQGQAGRRGKVNEVWRCLALLRIA